MQSAPRARRKRSPVTAETRAKLSAAHSGKYRGEPTSNRFINNDGHWMLTGELARIHPLVNSAGHVAEHRAVLYDKIGPGPHPCHVCGKMLSWGGKQGIHADHLDDDKLNNDEDNLAPACLVCNWHRGDPWGKRWHPEEVGTIQTFLTYRGFAKTAAALDMQRLGKQRVETLQILRALRHEGDIVGNPWPYKMWEGHEEALVLYGLVICHEWRIVRGFKDNTWGELAKLAVEYNMIRQPKQLDGMGGEFPMPVVYPRWMTENWVLRSHRSNLIRKLPGHYGEHFGACPENMPYIWPVWDETARPGYRLFISSADLDRVNRSERTLPRAIELNGDDGEVVVVE